MIDLKVPKESLLAVCRKLWCRYSIQLTESGAFLVHESRDRTERYFIMQAQLDNPQYDIWGEVKLKILRGHEHAD
jgi:hypothetical protein